MEYHILHLGAGVQSTTVYLLGLDGRLPQRFDAAIFADTQEESDDVYRHLDWLDSLGGPRIYRRTAGRLGDDLKHGVNKYGKAGPGGRYTTIPAFTAAVEGHKLGIIRRQCTKDYKIEVIGQAIRRDFLKLKPRRTIPKNVMVHSYIGISVDEVSRASRIYETFFDKPRQVVHFPLLDLNWTRDDCQTYLSARVPHEVPRSACVFCPFHTDDEWKRIQLEDRRGWARAVEIDEALRIPGNVVNRNLDQKLYLHDSCIPLVQIDFQKLGARTDGGHGFAVECEGGCGY